MVHSTQLFREIKIRPKKKKEEEVEGKERRWEEGREEGKEGQREREESQKSSSVQHKPCHPYISVPTSTLEKIRKKTQQDNLEPA